MAVKVVTIQPFQIFRIPTKVQNTTDYEQNNTQFVASSQRQKKGRGNQSSQDYNFEIEKRKPTAIVGLTQH